MRHPREIAPGLPNHFIVRGNNRRRLFSYRPDYLLYLGFVREAAALYGCVLHAMALLANHIHMIMTPPTKEAASAFIKYVSQRYAQHRNRLRDGSGKLFEQRFKSVPILNEVHLAIATAYVDRNAVHHQLCDDPADYPWTTYGHHIGRPELSAIPSDLWTPSSWYLGLGGAEAYRQWVEECQAIDATFAKPSKKRLRRPNGDSAV